MNLTSIGSLSPTVANSVSFSSSGSTDGEVSGSGRPPRRPGPPVGQLKEKLTAALEEAGIDIQDLQSDTDNSSSSSQEAREAAQEFLGSLFQAAQGGGGPPGGGPPGGGPPGGGPPGGGPPGGGPPPGGGYSAEGLGQGLQELANNLGSEETAEIEDAFSTLLQALGSDEAEGGSDVTQQLKDVLQNLSSALATTSQSEVAEGNLVSLAV